MNYRTADTMGHPIYTDLPVLHDSVVLLQQTAHRTLKHQKVRQVVGAQVNMGENVDQE